MINQYGNYVHTGIINPDKLLKSLGNINSYYCRDSFFELCRSFVILINAQKIYQFRSSIAVMNSEWATCVGKRTFHIRHMPAIDSILVSENEANPWFVTPLDCNIDADVYEVILEVYKKEYDKYYVSN